MDQWTLTSVKYGLEPKSELDIILFHIVIVTFHIVSFFAIKHLKEFSTVMPSGFSFLFFLRLGYIEQLYLVEKYQSIQLYDCVDEIHVRRRYVMPYEDTC